MKIFQLMSHDGYYPDSPVTGDVFASREGAREAFKALNLKTPFGLEPYELEEECTEYCDYFIEEREVK